MKEKVIVAATGNEHKLKEIREILQGYTVLSAAEAGFFDEVEETGKDFLENAFLKARAVALKTGMPALADDSGLCVKALDGAPGIYSARYSGGGSAENRKLLLKNLEGISEREACFVCAIALVCPDGTEYSSIGKTFGSILHEERGQGGFGYDSLFLSDDLKKSFAQASEEEKNSVSHRGRALKGLLDSLKEWA